MNTSPRILILALCLGVLYLVIAGRLAFVQVVKGQEYAALCKGQSRTKIVLPAHRGAIRDAQGRTLALSIEKGVAVTPELIAAHYSANYADSLLKRSRKDLSIRRMYPAGELAGSVLGFTNREGKGLGGIERTFESYMHGEDGWALVQRDAHNVRYRQAGLPSCPPTHGADVFLTINIDMQKIAQNVLRRTIVDKQAKGGTCIIMEPSTGRILAMADEPPFNPNFVEAYPLANRMNRCIGVNYEPGSTFKVITASAALQEKLFNETSLIDGQNGAYQVYSETIRDHHAVGLITFNEALTYSSNVCFAKVSNALGNKRLYQYAKDFGFGSRTGVSLPGEEAGIVHPLDKWSGRTRVTMAIGQELSATFLQMISAFSAIANDGAMMKPIICDKVVSSDGRVLFSEKPTPVRRVINVETAQRLRRMMALVVDKGTAVKAQIQGIPVAGKTGTSQKIDVATGTYSNSRYCSSFIGFIPVEKPLLVIGVMVDEPADASSGGMAAAPAFKEIVAQVITNPSLDWAQKLFDRTDSTGSNVTQMVRADTAKTKEHIVGDSTSFVKNIPVSHNTQIAAAKACEGKPGCMPWCVGMDARNAAMELLGKGVTPYVTGMGVVEGQSIHAGAIARHAEVCTLYCRIGG